ncbi:hypothetical protein Taro_035810 [Colocasia esculenta]|uniref:Uncharacterized protein n=1 Tax=Colocasia esculenta TaxID=4460 RepID=A0A843W4X1_COLES|nr:hypothetical protein [Colocasia esculenta]
MFGLVCLCVVVRCARDAELSRFFPESPFVASGGGSSQECFVFISGHRFVAPVVQCVPFGWAAFWSGSPITALGTLGGGSP